MEKIVGQALKKEREARGVSLADIVGETRISIRFLQALEDEEFDLFPGKFYVHYYIKNYLRACGADETAFFNTYQDYLNQVLKKAGDMPPGSLHAQDGLPQVQEKQKDPPGAPAARRSRPARLPVPGAAAAAGRGPEQQAGGEFPGAGFFELPAAGGRRLLPERGAAGRAAGVRRSLLAAIVARRRESRGTDVPPRAKPFPCTATS